MFIPKEIFIFLKTPKDIEIKKFDPQKMDRAYVCMKISESPPWDFIVHQYSTIKVHHHIIIIGFLINVQVQRHHPHQWAPFQVSG